ncbi:hypothetical protein C8R45DRAFT_1212645 [Mycena sanguinolenta]|nr:hypothetical protein C8R45DRAFT_1212645 [Mycena sanguinolenta]
MDHELAFLATATPVEEQTDANFLHHQLVTSLLLTYSAIRVVDFPSRGLLGMSAGDRVYVNTNAPSSAVVCGVQGSGKSHTVSCFLECALIPDPRVGQLPEPLSALAFHFDTQDSGRPCEAAFISSPAVQSTASALPPVTVLCSPSNINRRRRAYASLPQVRVEPLYLSERDLTADRMLAIMACDNLDTMPLYMHTALHIIRTMGIDAFSYAEFKRRVRAERLNPAQRAMIELRLQLLDAFVPPGAREIETYFGAGGLVLVDLTDPFLDGLTATVLFDIVLGAFTQWQTTCGKLVVLDEAHKYLTNSDSARLTQSVSNIMRLQRHLATRFIIATQEPTVVLETILDLASTIICHRFSSPAWCAHLSRHVSAGTGSDSASWYEKVMSLPTGDALVFSPAAVIRTDGRGGVGVLGRDHLRLRVRPRLTLDGGASLLAVGRSVPSASSSSATASPLMPMSLPFEALNPDAAQTSGSAASSLSTAMPSPFNPYIPTPLDDILQSSPAGPDPSDTLGALAAPADGSSMLAQSPSSPPEATNAIPARLKHLLGWLSRNGAADRALPLGDARGALLWLGKKDLGYPEMKGKKWWTSILKEAEEHGLIELINKNLSKKQLKALGEEKKIRLLNPGPWVYAAAQ